METFFTPLANIGIQQLAPYQPGSSKAAPGQKTIKLSSNENPYGPSPYAIEAVMSMVAKGHRYPAPDGLLLKEALAELYHVDINQITLGNGSDELIGFLVQTFANSTQSVMSSQYGFAAYKIAAGGLSAAFQEIPAENYGVNLTAMGDAIDENTRLIFIANPNNPTGSLLTHEALSKFLSALPKNIICVLDEAYYEYHTGGANYPDGVALLKDYPNLVILRTFSKAYGLAGLRLGYAISNPEIADLLNRIRLPFNANALSQAAGLAALNDKPHLDFCVRETRRILKLTAEHLAPLPVDILPPSANFLCIDFKKPAGPIFEALLAQGLIVRPLLPYQMPNHLRVSIGTEDDMMHFCEQLEAILKESD